MSGKGAERDILRLPIFNHIMKGHLPVYALCSAYAIVLIQYLSTCDAILSDPPPQQWFVVCESAR